MAKLFDPLKEWVEVVDEYCELQSKCHLSPIFSIENEEGMENYP